MRVGIGMFLLLLLTGCRSNLLLDLYVQDLLDGSMSFSEGVVSIEVSSCDSSTTNDLQRQLVSLFKDESNAQILGCRNQGFDSILDVGVQVGVNQEKPKSIDINIFTERSKDSEGDLVVGMRVDESLVTRIETLASDNFQSFDYRSLDITVNLINDLRSTIYLSTEHAWIDSTPYDSVENYAIKGRGKVKIRLSNVMTDLLLKKKSPEVFRLLSQS